MAFGDVKSGGKINARMNDGQLLTLQKIAPILASGVSAQHEYQLIGAIPSPQHYNALSIEGGHAGNYFYLPNDLLIHFCPISKFSKASFCKSNEQVLYSSIPGMLFCTKTTSPTTASHKNTIFLIYKILYYTLGAEVF